MKKIVLIALALFIATTFAFTAHQFHATTSYAFIGKVCPNVGWNTSVCAIDVSPESVQSVSFLSRPPVITPNVGWNT